MTDHLGNVRVVVNDAGVIEQVNQFYPYGESIELDPASANPAVETITENPYKWSGKEWDEEQGAYDFGARMYSASDARWTTMDPLCEKYYSISPYAYCAGNPVNLVDPEGREIGDFETILFGLKHPGIAIRIGTVKSGRTNISTNAVRFATRGEILYGAKPRKQEERGSEAGAFRHALWQAAICAKYGGKIAMEVGNAHEDNVSSFDYTKRTFESINEGDTAVDLLNNQVGRTISSRGMCMKELALKVLNTYETMGLYTLKQMENGEREIIRTTLDKERAEQLRDLFLKMDENGFFEYEK